MASLILDARSTYGQLHLLDLAKFELSLRTDTLVIDARPLLADSLDEGAQFLEYVMLVRRLMFNSTKYRHTVLLGGPDLAALVWPHLDLPKDDPVTVPLFDTWHWALDLVTLRHRLPLLVVEDTTKLAEGVNGWDHELFAAASLLAERIPKTPLTPARSRYSYSGHPSPLVVFVGDRLSPTLVETAWHKWPFALPLGSSAFLGRAMSQAGLSLSAHQIGFTNINDKQGLKTVRKLRDLVPGVGLVALGQEAQRALVSYGFRPDMHVHHPQYARRFRYHELRQYGEELVEGYNLALGIERDGAQRP